MRKIFPLLFLPLFIVLASDPAQAIPAFTRKYKTTCMTCHTSPTMLNEFGLRFQANGYQLPGTIDETPIWDQDIVPVSFMLHAMWMWNKNTEESDEASVSTTGFNFVDPHGDLFAGGTLGRKVSYFTEFELQPEGFEIETAFLIFNNILELSHANFRVGKFFLDVPFPSRLSLAEDIKPLVYTYNPFGTAGAEDHEHAEEEEESGGHEHAMLGSSGTLLTGTAIFRALDEEEEEHGAMTEGALPSAVRLSSPQLGASVFGFIPEILDGTRYEIALFNWRKNKRPDWFFRVNQTLYVNDAPFRVGFIYLNGRHQLDEIDFRSDFWRFGIDAEVYDPWTKKVNIQFQYLKGEDDDISLAGGLQPRDMTGGFIGSNVFILPEKLIVYGRYDWLNAHPEKTRRWTSVLRYHLAPNVFIDFMYANTWTNFEHEEAEHHEEEEEHHEMTFLRPMDAMDMVNGGLEHVNKRRNQMFMIMFMFIF